MKKVLCIICFVLASVILLTGCDEVVDGYDRRADKLFESAEACINSGDTDAAEEWLSQALGSYPSGETCKRYLTLLAKNGKLDFLSENFPSEDELLFRGKPLSEYDTNELLEIAGLGDKTDNRDETAISDTVYFYGDKADEETVLPYGMTKDMSLTEMYEALGFSAEQAELLKGVYFIRIDLSDESPIADAKKSQYAPFTQHPAEEWEFTLRYKRCELTFRNNGSSVSRFTVKVFF